MAVLAHCWTRGELSPRTQAFDDARAAVAAARARAGGSAWVLAMPGEGVPRRPTKWELGHGRAFATRAAARVTGGRPLPAGLNSGYALLPGPAAHARRPACAAPDAAPPARPAPASPPDVPPRAAAALAALRAPVTRLDALFAPLAPRRGASPGREDEILAVLEAAGGPVFERESSLRRDWSSRRGRVIAEGRRAAYCGHGMWVLLGRDVPVTPGEAAGICQAARGMLWFRGGLRLTDLHAALAGRGGPAARLDTPVYLAALLRRCADVEVDGRTGMARIVGAPAPAPRQAAAAPRAAMSSPR